MFYSSVLQRQRALLFMDNVDVNLLHQCSVLVTSKASGIITRSTMVDANAACMATNPASRPGRSSQIRFWHVGNCGDRGR